MPRCPSCGSARIVIRVDESREALCVACGTRWTQQGGSQRKVRRPPLVTSLERRPRIPRMSSEVEPITTPSELGPGVLRP
jgi:transposase-like protein